MTTTIELAKQAGTAWCEILDEGYLDRFRALIVAERDRELRGVGLEPKAWHYSVPMPDGQMFICASTKRLEFEFGVTPVEAGNVSEPLYTAEQFAAARLQDQQRIAELEANLKRATAALAERKPDCKTCANRGAVVPMAQESYCEQCIHGAPWRVDHYKPTDKEPT